MLQLQSLTGQRFVRTDRNDNEAVASESFARRLHYLHVPVELPSFRGVIQSTGLYRAQVKSSYRVGVLHRPHRLHSMHRCGRLVRVRVSKIRLFSSFSSVLLVLFCLLFLLAKNLTAVKTATWPLR